MLGRMVSDMMVKPFQSPLFDDPANYGLRFQDVEFAARDGVKLRGWLIGGGNERVIIQSHFGVQCNRAGYCPKGKGLIKMWSEDISFLRHAKYLTEQGYSVLMYDFRNHGESDPGVVPWVSWGPEEAKDVVAAVEFVSNHPEYRGADLGLLSICMGASATTYAYGLDEGLSQFDNIKAMIAVQPLLYRDFVAAFGMPGFMERAGSRVTLERTGLDLNASTFLPEAGSIRVPTRIVQNRNDPWTRLDFVQSFHDELRVERDLLWVEAEKKRAAAYDYLGREPASIFDWFDGRVGS